MSHTRTDSSAESEWNWVGTAAADTAGRVKIPPQLSEVGLFEQFTEAHWGYEATTGTIVVSSNEFQLSGYESVASTSIGGPSDGHRCTVPHQYNPKGSGAAHIEAQNVDPTVTGEEELHFLYHDDAVERDEGWCYVLTTTELEQRLLAPADWPECVHPKRTRLY